MSDGALPAGGALVERWRLKAARRPGERDGRSTLAPFIEELASTLSEEPGSRRSIEMAAQHGRNLREQGLNVEDVVQDFGDLREALAELAEDSGVALEGADLIRLGRRIDGAAATAVGHYVNRQLAAMADAHKEDMNHRLGVFAHGLRNHVTTATLAAHISRTGKAGLQGPSGQILDRALKGLAQMVDRSLAEALLAHETEVEPQVFALREFIADVRGSASLEADEAQCEFVVEPVEVDAELRGDRDLLLAAVGSLLQNAFKFTRRSTEVRLKTSLEGERVRIHIEDNCGGLPPGGLERMFLPYGQRRGDKEGVGLGLSIARRSVEANGGLLAVHDVPGCGCIFTVDLPRYVEPLPWADATA